MSARRKRAHDEMLHVYTFLSCVVTRSRVRYKLFAFERFFSNLFISPLFRLFRGTDIIKPLISSLPARSICRLSGILINRRLLSIC